MSSSFFIYEAKMIEIRWIKISSIDNNVSDAST